MTTTTSIPEQRQPDPVGAVFFDGANLVIKDLRVIDGPTAILARRILAEHGPDVLVETLKQALVVGVLAVTAAAAATDSGSGVFAATLAGLAANVETTGQRALSGMETVLGELDKGQKATTAATAAVLAELPERLERALAGEAATVRDAVRQSVAEVHQRALDDLKTALHTHAETLRVTTSADNPASPLGLLRGDVTAMLTTFRQEVMTGLAAVQASQTAQQAVARNQAKLSPEKGRAWEQVVIDAVNASCAATGDLWIDSSGTPGEGSTAKVGDILLGLLGPNVPDGVRLTIEAKNRTRPFSMRELIDLARAAARNRKALGCLILVPDAGQLPPGSGQFLKLGPLSWAVAIQDEDPTLFLLVLAVVRQLVLTAAIGNKDNTGRDHTTARTELQHAVALLTKFDDLSTAVGNGRKNLDGITKVAAEIRDQLSQHLTSAAEALRA
jgi:hypothetical protein